MMELCYRLRLFTALWCGTEIWLFGGTIYGWGSLVFILKEEGFYKERCTNLTINNEKANDSIVYYSSLDTQLNFSAYRFEGNHLHSYVDDLQDIGCPEQETFLNLWFSIAVGFMYIGLAGLGQMTERMGTRLTRAIFILVFASGTLCIAFATPEHSWLLCPGLCCIGIAGLVMFATSMQVANLFVRVRTTIVAIFCGFFDVSSMTQQLVKIAYENNISRKTSYLILTFISVCMFSVSTFVFLPKTYVVGRKKFIKTHGHPEKKTIDGSCVELEHLKSKIDEKIEKHDRDVHERSNVTSSILSFTFISHVIWMSLNVVIFVSFIGLLNPWLEHLTGGQKNLVNQYLSSFAYITISTAAMAVITGFLYDFLRKRYAACRYPASVYRPVVLPMILCDTIGASVFIIPLIGSLTMMIVVFILFTMFRSLVYSLGIAFINEAFPPQHFGALYGLMTFINGLCSLLQYGLFEWNNSYEGSVIHVNIFLSCLALISLLHPLQLWIRSKHNRDNEPLTNAEFPILPVK